MGNLSTDRKIIQIKSGQTPPKYQPKYQSPNGLMSLFEADDIQDAHQEANKKTYILRDHALLHDEINIP